VKIENVWKVLDSLQI